MKKVLLSLVILGGLTLSLNGHFSWNNIARAQATAVPSCQFAGYNPNGSLINTTIVCVSPVASGGAVVTVGATATACGAAVAPSPTGGAVVVQVPVCATATAGPSLPLSVANGGTGTAAPAPTGTNGCTVGTFPSLVVSCPGTATAGPSLPLSVANGGTGTSAPAPTSSNGCSVTGTWPSQTFACPTAGAAALPSTSASPPIIVATPTGQVNISCPSCLIGNTSIGGGGQFGLYAVPSPTADPSPFPGYLQMQGGFVVGPAPSPYATYEPNAVLIATFNACGGGASSVGTSASTTSTIIGEALNVNCSGQLFSVDHAGDGGFAGSVVIPYGFKFQMNQASSSTNTCFITDNVTAGFQIGSGGGLCPLTLQSTATQNKGQLTCTLSTLVCTQTATVISGAICTAAYDTAATTVTASLLLPLTVKVVTTTLTISMQGAPTASGTAAADYLCL